MFSRKASRIWFAILVCVAFVLMSHGLAFAQSADMRISSLSHNLDFVTLGDGQNISFFVSGTNSGPGAATGVMIVDTLPAGVNFVSATSSIGSCSQAAGVVTCNVGSMGVFAGVSVTVTVAPVTATASGTNTVSISANEVDPNPGNNSASDAVTIVAANADLKIGSMSHSADQITLAAGQTLNWFVNVSNSGPSNSTGVTVTDTLPAGVNFVSASVTQGSCTQSAGTVTCAIGNINRFVGVQITITVTPVTVGVATHTATVSANEPDPNTANNSGSDGVTIVAANADLRISSMSHSPDPANLGAGQNITFSTSIFNNGPSDATGVTFTDTLPAGVTFSTATSTQGSCALAMSTVTCNIGAMARSTGVNVTVVVTPTTAGVATHNGIVSATEPDPNTANNSRSDSVTIAAASADLRINSMSHSPEPPTVGQNMSYSISVFNSGPSNATGVTFTDTLPGGVTFVSASSTQGACMQAAGTVTCNIGAMTPSAGVSITITVTPTGATALVNTASVSGNEPDPNQGNNSGRDATTARTGPPLSTDADVKVTMSHSPEPATFGSDQFIQYNINVSNGGPATATGVSLTDTLPAGVTFVSATVSPVPQGSCSQSAGTVTCALGTLTPFQGVSVTIYVTPNAAGNVTNTATATATQDDPNPGNNTAVDTLSILASGADMRATISHSPDPFTIGQDTFVQYTVSVFNNGPSGATGVTLTDTLPSGVTFGGAAVSPATQGTCTFDSISTVTCNLNNMNRFTSATVSIFVTPSAPGNVTNTVNVSSATPDPNPANNSATDIALVNDVSADLRLTASHSPESLTLGTGQFLQMFLTVFNNGPSPASNVTLTDVLPMTATFAGISLSPPTQGNCTQDATTNTVTCNLNSMRSSNSTNVTIFTNPTVTGNLTHTPNVTATETDPNPANNSATDGVAVNAANADMRISSLSHSPDPARVGQSFQYFVNLSNSGPSAASNVTFTDTLPASFTFNGASVSPPTQGSCSQSAGTVTCNLNTMGPGASVSINIFVTPTATGSVVSNTASVSANEPDPIPANNSRTDNVTVNAAGPGPAPAASTAATAAPTIAVNRTIAYNVVDAGPLPGGAGGPIMNNSGLAVGYSSATGQATHAVIYNRDGMLDLGTLGGQNSYAFSINASGQVVGQSETDSNQTHAFLYSNGAMSDLGTLGGDFSAAWGINDAGDVAGASSLGGGFSHAFLYQNGQMLDLNDMIAADSGWVLEMSSGFDASGHIVGYGNFNGQERQFVLIPVPTVPSANTKP